MCNIDEAQNSLGDQRCSSADECKGARNCSSSGWCQGDSQCPDEPSEEDKCSVNEELLVKCKTDNDCTGKRTCSRINDSCIGFSDCPNKYSEREKSGASTLALSSACGLLTLASMTAALH